MIQTYSLVCRQCKKALWVAQRSLDGPLRVYATEEATEALARFLEKHEGHSLTFLNDCTDVVQECEDKNE